MLCDWQVDLKKKKTPRVSSTDDYSFHTQRQMDGLYDDLANLQAARQTPAQQKKRKMSEHKTEVAMLRREVRELQRTVQMNSFPYCDNVEEHNSLIDDYLYNDQEDRNEELRRRSWDVNNRWKCIRRDSTSDPLNSRKTW